MSLGPAGIGNPDGPVLE